MNILVFEWLIGGGLLAEEIDVPSSLSLMGKDSASDPIASLLKQGAAMAVAAAADFAREGMKVVLPVDHRLADNPILGELPRQVEVFPINISHGKFESLRERIQTLAVEADRVLLIAPETDDLLLQTIDWIEPGKLIGPDREFVWLTSNKPRLNSFLREHQFDRVPEQWTNEAFLQRADSLDKGIESGLWPVVLKPIDGAGSDSTWLIPDMPSYLERMKSIQHPERFFIQRFVTGHPVSLSVIAGEEITFLPPTRQLFDAEPFGHFVGSQHPISPDLAERARGLAKDLLRVLPSTTGYFGIDMVLSDSQPNQDWLIEVNPRLTMSYPALRDIVDFNLAAAMLKNVS